MSFLLTESGRHLDVIAPNPADIELTDIAAGLARELRFNGLTRVGYSVAQHSVMCFEHAKSMLGRQATDRILKFVLLHDASEAFLGDIVQPLKAYLPDYQDIENTWMDAIHRRFKLDKHNVIDKGLVKQSDQYCFAVEVAYLCKRPSDYLFTDDVCEEIRKDVIARHPALYAIRYPWGFEESKERFLQAAHSLNLS